MTAKFIFAGSAVLACAVGGGVMVGCDTVERVAGKIVAPGAQLNRIDLVDAPNARELARYGCHQLLNLGDLCPFNNINKSKLLFSFDIVFDLENNNEKVPIPLVEILLGTTVYDDEDLGTVCVSFCDPNTEECESTTNAEEACDVENAEEIDSPSDLVPTFSELTNLAESAVNGEFGNNHEFRVIPAQGTIESHIQFDFNIDTMLNLGRRFIEDLGQDLIDGRPLRMNIPYSMEGNLFFNVPEMGRFAAGFGPYSNTWNITTPD